MSWSGGVRSQLKMENRKSKISAAEGVGFEPTRACALPVFKTGAINHSTTPPGIGIVPLRISPARREAPAAAAFRDCGNPRQKAEKPAATTAPWKNGLDNDLCSDEHKA